MAGIHRSTYYYYAKNRTKPDKYAEIQEQIQRIFHKNKGRYGYRRITMELHNRSYIINHKTVQRLMKNMGLHCAVRLKKYHSYKGEVGKISPNLIYRNFNAVRPNMKWVTDITEFSLLSQKVYLSPILDLYNDEIISYTISMHPRFSQVSEMLEKAFEKIPDHTNLILHSDQGWQYQMKAYQQSLAKKGVRQSMSRKGNCLDNAVMENFFGLLKTELFYLQKFDSIQDFIQELHDYINYYNHHRIKARLKGMSPVNYRTHSKKIA